MTRHIDNEKKSLVLHDFGNLDWIKVSFSSNPLKNNHLQIVNKSCILQLRFTYQRVVYVRNICMSQKETGGEFGE